MAPPRIGRAKRTSLHESPCGRNFGWIRRDILGYCAPKSPRSRSWSQEGHQQTMPLASPDIISASAGARCADCTGSSSNRSMSRVYRAKSPLPTKSEQESRSWVEVVLLRGFGSWPRFGWGSVRTRTRRDASDSDAAAFSSLPWGVCRGVATKTASSDANHADSSRHSFGDLCTATIPTSTRFRSSIIDPNPNSDEANPNLVEPNPSSAEPNPNVVRCHPLACRNLPEVLFTPCVHRAPRWKEYFLFGRAVGNMLPETAYRDLFRTPNLHPPLPPHPHSSPRAACERGRERGGRTRGAWT